MNEISIPLNSNRNYTSIRGDLSRLKMRWRWKNETQTFFLNIKTIHTEFRHQSRSKTHIRESQNHWLRTLARWRYKDDEERKIHAFLSLTLESIELWIHKELLHVMSWSLRLYEYFSCVNFKKTSRKQHQKQHTLPCFKQVAYAGIFFSQQELNTNAPNTTKSVWVKKMFR